jgi:hypothetical protein
MDRMVYVVQSFSRGANGDLVWDAPAWSRDRTFAVSLTRALSRSKAGVVTIGAALSASGEVGPDGEIIASLGCVPTSLILARTVSGAADAPEAPLRQSA